MRLRLRAAALLIAALGACAETDSPADDGEDAGRSGASAGARALAGQLAADGGGPSRAGVGAAGAGSGAAGSGSGAAGGSGVGSGAAGAAGAGAGGQGGSAAGSGEGAPAVRYVGRVDLEDPRGGRFSWSGSGVVARFRGTALSVDLSGGQEYTVLLDGVLRPAKLTISSGETPIESGLSNGEHTVELYRRTEANQGVSQFLGFRFGPGGVLLAPPPAPSRRLELIGDSISVGYGNEGADQSCTFTPQTENHYQSFGAIAARAVGAELHTIAWSGRGMVCNYGDDADSCSDPFPNLYDRTLPTLSDSSWDFARYRPDAVILNLGTNDYSTDADPSEAEFTQGYRAFLEHVRAVYPDAFILCTCGPLLYGSELDSVRAYIANAVSATGDDKILTFEIPSQSEADGLGCDYHPSIRTHEKMAALLVGVLQRELGW
jgi:lysophospholipase L1-like esterase